MESFCALWTPRLLSVLRIAAALLFLQHGLADLFGFPQVPTFPDDQFASFLRPAGIVEVVLGSLLLIGLFTRPAALILFGVTAIGYAIGHAPRGFFPILNGGEHVALYCFVFLYVAAAGGGPWSADSLRRRGRAR